LCYIDQILRDKPYSGYENQSQVTSGRILAPQTYLLRNFYIYVDAASQRKSHGGIFYSKRIRVEDTGDFIKSPELIISKHRNSPLDNF